jgi:hypothetical protein
MAYTERQIKTIHQQGTATKNRKYVSTKGDVYIGQQDGRLLLSPNDTAQRNLSNRVSTLENTKPIIIEKETTVTGLSYADVWAFNTLMNC